MLRGLGLSFVKQFKTPWVRVKSMDWVTALKEIQKAQEDDRLVIFVGAGVSKNSGVPSWWELIKKFGDELNYSRCNTCSEKASDCPKSDCKDRYEYTQEDFLRIPEYYYQQDTSENHANYFDLIQSTLHCDNNSNPIDDEIFSAFPRHIITTNYDSLLEKSESINRPLYTVVTQDSDLLAVASDRYIIKMHGDLEKTDTIVLKESDYIKYEQEHPLICTFIKSLLINHTFVFLGYSLNDNNLNLIIGWINYFKEIHDIKERPANFWINSTPTTSFEETRLENHNIFVIDLSSLPSDLEAKASVPTSITNDTGRKLFTFLRCITDPRIIYQYIPIEDRIAEKYQLLNPYSKISHQDLIAVYPLGRTQFLDTELVFYDIPWYECIQKLMSDKHSVVSEAFRRAGISAIYRYNNNTSFPVPTVDEPIDSLFRLYIDNDYIALNNKLENCTDLVRKMYYSKLLGKDKKDIEVLLAAIAEQEPPTDYVSILLHKMRARIATISLFEHQNSKTLELRRAFNVSPPEKYKNAVSFLRMLFESPEKNMQEMGEILSEHERRYAFNSRTSYSSHPHIGIWKLKAFAYDYYFFFKENGIPLDYFLETKEYLSYYLKALLCSFSPESGNSDILEIGAHEERAYPIGEVDLDMLVKYTSPETLKSWLEKYSIQKLKIEDGLDITKKFVNLCGSLSRFKIKYWCKQVHCFVIILCLIDLDETNMRAIFKALADVVIEASKSGPQMAVEIFDAIEVAVNHLLVKEPCAERTLLLDALLTDDISHMLKKGKLDSFVKLLGKTVDEISPDVKKRIKRHNNKINDIDQKVKEVYFFRSFYSKKYCRSFFLKHLDYLLTKQCFVLLMERNILLDESCWAKFISTLEKQDATRKAQPGMRTFPDWLMVTIEECMILKLLGFDINLTSLEPYAHYSEPLSFMVSPETFDYSQVDTGNYMWQNLIYSKEYQPYFIAHKSDVLSEELRKNFKLGVATNDQQKIVYGILLEKGELQSF